MKKQILFGALGALILGGCVSVPDEMRTKEALLRDLEQKKLPVVQLHSWEQALGLVKKSASMRRLALQLEYARAEHKQFYKDLLPEVSLFGSFRESVGDLGNVDAGSFLMFANGFVRLPNPLELQVTYLRNVISEYAKNLEYEMAYRESVAKVYRLTYDLIDLEKQIQIAESLAGDKRIDNRYAVEVELERLRGQKVELDANLSIAFGVAGFWKTKGITLPKLEASEKWVAEGGELMRRIAAVKIVSADLTERGVRVSSLPSVSASLSMPPLFSLRDGNLSESFDLQNVQVGSAIVYPLDISGRRKFNREKLSALNKLNVDSVFDEYISQRASALRAASVVQRAESAIQNVREVESRAKGEMARTLRGAIKERQSEVLDSQIRLLVWNDQFFGEVEI